MSSEARVTVRFATFLPHGFCLKMGWIGSAWASLSSGFALTAEAFLDAVRSSSAKCSSHKHERTRILSLATMKNCPVVVHACDSSTGEQRRRSPGTPVQASWWSLCAFSHLSFQISFMLTHAGPLYVPLRANVKPFSSSFPSLLPILSCLLGDSLYIFPLLPSFS